MKREFGSKLIEDFLAHQDLRLVADTSGAYIPGHGTPTVIIVGCNRPPVGSTVRAVLGIRGEPGQPENPAKGVVWTSIVDHIDSPGWDDTWVTITDLDRVRLGAHPWSLTGGYAADVAAALEKAGTVRLRARVVSIGRTTASGEDEAFFTLPHKGRALGLDDSARHVVIGECLRDYLIDNPRLMWWPYQDKKGRIAVDEEKSAFARASFSRTGASFCIGSWWKRTSFFAPGRLRELRRLLERAVPPADLRAARPGRARVLLGRVLRVVDEDVGALRELRRASDRRPRSARCRSRRRPTCPP